MPTFLFCEPMDTASLTYRERIERLIEPLIAAEHMELVELDCLKMKSRWLVRIYIDKEGGVTLDDCSEVSHQVGDLLDVHGIPPGPYTLEVSSPGLDRPLTKDKDFEKYLGHRVRVRTREKVEGARNFHGKLLDFREEEDGKILFLDVEGKTFRIPRDLVLKANLEYES